MQSELKETEVNEMHSLAFIHLGTFLIDSENTNIVHTKLSNHTTVLGRVKLYWSRGKINRAKNLLLLKCLFIDLYIFQ